MGFLPTRDGPVPSPLGVLSMALNSGTLHPDILTSAAETDLIPRRGDADYISGRESDDAIFASSGDNTIAGDNISARRARST